MQRLLLFPPEVRLKVAKEGRREHNKFIVISSSEAEQARWTKLVVLGKYCKVDRLVQDQQTRAAVRAVVTMLKSHPKTV